MQSKSMASGVAGIMFMMLVGIASRRTGSRLARFSSAERVASFPGATAPSRAWRAADNSPIWTKASARAARLSDHRGPAAVGDGRKFDLHGLGSPVPAPPENPTHHKKTIRLFAAKEPSESFPSLEACGGANGAGSRTTSTLGRLASSSAENVLVVNP